MRARWIAIGAGLIACKGAAPPAGTPAAGRDAAAGADAAAVAIAEDAAAPIAIDGGGAIAPAPGGPARVALIHGPELLGSEERAFERWRPLLAASRPRGELVDATDAEIAIARAYLGEAEPPAPPPLPAAWSDAPVVVVVVLLPPIGRKPKRTSGGLAGLVVFRPPAPAPVLIRKVPAGAISEYGLDAVGPWIATTLAVVAGSPP